MKDLIIKSFKDINLIAVFIAAVCYNYAYSIADPDFWSRIYCGATYIDHGWVLYKDIFAFTETKPIWVDHEWLSGIIFFLFIKYLGPAGILLLKYLCIFLELWLIYLCIRQRTNSNINVLFLLLILMSIEPAFLSNIRPHNFTYIFFTFWLLILEHSRINDTTKYLWVLPATIPVWVNLHAGCISGIALVGVYMVSQIIEKKAYKPYLYIIPFSALLMLVNPYGYHYFGYVIDELTSTHDAITEWLPVDIFSLTNFLFFKILLILTIIAFAFAKDQKADPVGFILILAFAYFGFKHGRHNVLYGIIVGVFIYERLQNIYQQLIKEALKVRSEKFVNMANFLIGTGLAVFTIIMFSTSLFTLNFFNWKLTVPVNEYPIHSVQFLKQNNLKGNLLLPFKWGGYVTWMLYPNIIVSIDGRHVEIFPIEIHHQSNDFHYGRGEWDKLLKDYTVDMILIDKKESPSYKKLLEEGKWKVVFEDAISAVMLPANYSDTDNLKKIDIIAGSKINHLDSYFLKK
ncbi:MAG: hypothetical protein AB1782_09555 [Cyanobacteriota bacterium]